MELGLRFGAGAEIQGLTCLDGKARGRYLLSGDGSGDGQSEL